MNKKIIPSSVHGLRRSDFSKNACSVAETLQKAGFEAYIVGGGVRDLLLGLHPKDFDVATNAKPEEIRNLFPNCLLIGKRFRLAHIRFKNDIIEVATFRTSHEASNDLGSANTRDGIITRDNVYGSLEDDAIRRDFTINALYFNPADESIIDFTFGWEDILSRKLRLIGTPKIRYQEDPIRILRAIRFLTKLNFELEDSTKKAIFDMVPLLAKMPPARMFDEYIKLFLHGHGVSNFKALNEFGAFKYLFPTTQLYIDHPDYKQLFLTSLHNTDVRVLEEKGVNPAFLISVFLWPVLQAHLKTEPGNPYHNLHFHMSMIVGEQIRATAMPRRLSHTIKEIWELQRPLESRKPRHIERVITHPRFRAAYDFLLLRSQIKEVHPSIANWWTDFQVMTPDNQAKAIKSLRVKKTPS